MQFRRILLPVVAALGLFAPAADAAIRYALAPNYDLTRTTAYPNGDKPVAGCTTPATWTAAVVGDGGGEICQEIASPLKIDFSVVGTSQAQNNKFIYKDCGGGDCQIEAQILNTYAGSTENNASTGVGIRESTAQSSWFMQGHSLQNGATGVQFTYGENGTYTHVNCAAGQGRPLWVTTTFDDSESDARGLWSADGSSWTQCVQVTRNLSNDLAYSFGASKSATITLQAEHDNLAVLTVIDAYTPTGGGGGPTLVSNISNQTAAQGTAFTLSCSANWTGATSYSMPANGSPFGFPTSTGLSFNTSTCAVTGTPNINDVGTRTITISGVSGGSTPSSFEMVVSAVPGNTLTIPSGTATVNCDTYESNDKVDPGDILQIDGGVRGPLKIRNCAGTPAAPIIIRNDITDNEPTTVRRSTGSTGGAIFECENCNGIEIDGTGKYSGADSGLLGYDETTQTRRGYNTTTKDLNPLTQAGIIVTRTATANRPSQYFRLSGTSCMSNATTAGYCKIKGIAVDGVDHADVATEGGSGICFSMNDDNVLRSANPGTWRENVTVENNLALMCGASNGEGIYFGPNQDAAAPNIPLRNITIRRNVLDTIARDGINTKSVLAGSNTIEYNFIADAGEGGAPTQNYGLNLNGQAAHHVRGNVIRDPGGHCLQITWQDLANIDVDGESRVFLVENEMYSDCGGNPGSSGYGVTVNHHPDADLMGLTIRSNTVATTVGAAVECSPNLVGEIITNNLFVGIGGATLSNCGGGTNNRTGAVADQNFVNAGAKNFELTSTSPARNSGTDSSPDTDYEGGARPQESVDDQGADEYVP